MTTCDLSNIGGVICKIGELLNAVVPVLLALGVVYFVYGVVSYVIGDSEEAKKKGRDTMIFGVIGFTIILGIWGLANIVLTTFDLKSPGPQKDTLQKLLPQ